MSKSKEVLKDIAEMWRDICNDYLYFFCEKHEFTYDDTMWVADNPGTVIMIGDMYVNMEDIRYDIDNNVPEDKFEKWYWKNLELYELGVEHWMNYSSYCKGAPDEWTEERMNKARDMRKGIHELEENLKELIEETGHEPTF